VRNNPINFNDPTGHKWTCTGTNDDHCYDDGNFDYPGSDGGLSGMAKNKNKDKEKDKHSWQRILYNMEHLQIYGEVHSDGVDAMNYVTASECDREGTCYPGAPLFLAMMHKFNNYCGGGNIWSETCVTSFWGYPQGILTVDDRNFSEQNDMATAILDRTGTSHGDFANDGYGCGGRNADGYAPYCDWANFDKSSEFITTLKAIYPSAFKCGDSACALVVPESLSIATYDQGNMYFVVMDYDIYNTYCLQQGICTH
jgi:hypothetical protein